MGEGLAAKLTSTAGDNKFASVANYVNKLPAITDEDIVANSMLHGLAKEAALRSLEAYDAPMKDATAQLLIAAQGPKAFTYVSPELTAALRVSNAVKNKDPVRLTGVPTKKEIKEAAADNAKMDKLKWKLTGNGIKADAWYNSYGGE